MTSADAQPDEPIVEPPAPPEVVEPPVANTTTPAHSAGKALGVLSVLVMVAGIVLVVAGGFTWFVVRDQLSAEKIVVSEDATYFAGNSVDGPLTAFSQANTIRKHALAASGGKTYAELDQDDPARDTVMTASFLRASLFTSVVSFGVAAFAAAIGVLMIIIGYVLQKLSKAVAVLQTPAVATA